MNTKLTQVSFAQTIKKIRHKKGGSFIATFLSSLLAGSALLSPIFMTGCGFQLRGYDSPMTYQVSNIILQIDSNAITLPLKQNLKRKLSQVGVNVVDDIGQQINNSDNVYTATISIDNLNFREYKLVGVLTEKRVVLSADVTYQKFNQANPSSNNPVAVTNTIQIERSYQYNEASVSIDDKQGEQIKQWLYENMAQRIADQYVALALAKTPLKSVETNSTQNTQ